MTNFLPEGWLMDTAANRSLCRNPAGLWEAFHTRTILEARALLCTQQHDLVVDFGFCRGIIPRCEGALGIAENFFQKSKRNSGNGSRRKRTYGKHWSSLEKRQSQGSSLPLETDCYTARCWKRWRAATA